MKAVFKKKIILGILISILIIFTLNFYSKGVRNFFYLISSPIQKIFWQTGNSISNFLKTISETRTLKKEKEELQIKIKELLAKNVKLREIEKENIILRHALDIGLQEEFELILSRVIGKDLVQDSLIINKGLTDGVFEGQPVLTEEKILVGRIEEVYKNFAKVMLLSNKKMSFGGKLIAPYQEKELGYLEIEQREINQEGVFEGNLNKEKDEILFLDNEISREIQGLVKGMGNFKVFFTLVPQYEEVKKGDLVVTTALGNIFPPGLLVGKVKVVKKLDIEPFQQIEIQPAFDIRKIDYLFIISNF